MPALSSITACVSNVIQPRSPSPPPSPSINLVRIGVPFQYAIPSFAAITATLRQIRLEGIDGNNQQSVVYDAFIRDCPTLNRAHPASIDITDWCYIPVSYCCPVLMLLYR